MNSLRRSPWYTLQSWTLEDVEAAVQHACRCGCGILPLFQTDEGQPVMQYHIPGE